MSLFVVMFINPSNIILNSHHDSENVRDFENLLHAQTVSSNVFGLLGTLNLSISVDVGIANYVLFLARTT